MDIELICGKGSSTGCETHVGGDIAKTAFRMAEKRYKLYRHDRRTERRKQVPATDFSDVVDFRFIDANSDRNRSLISVVECPNDLHMRCFSFAAVPGLLVFPEAFSEAEQQELCRDALLKYGDSRSHPNHLSKHQSKPRATNRYEPPMRWALLGFSYEWTSKTYCRSNYSHFPVSLKDRVERILRVCCTTPGFACSTVDNYEPQTAIVNYFPVGSMMMAHQDISEDIIEQPLVSISLGCSCVFLMGTSFREDPPYAFWLRSGDVAIFSGPSRLAFHSVPRIMDDCPLYLCSSAKEEHEDKEEDEEEIYWKEQMRHLRININVRQVYSDKCPFLFNI